MESEINFDKYHSKSPDYHYKQLRKKVFKYYNAYLDARYQIIIEIIEIISKRFKKKKLNLKLLDIGCGDAALFYLIQNHRKLKNIQLFGIDASPLAIKVAETKNPKALFKVAEVYDLPYENNTFDIIISLDVIEHVSDPIKMLSEIKRIGKKESYIIIGTPIKYMEQPLDKNHYQEFYPNQFKNIFKEFFNKILLLETHPLLYHLLYKKYIKFLKLKMPIYRYLINFKSIYFHKNPFLKLKTEINQPQTYMFGIGKLEK